MQDGRAAAGAAPEVVAAGTAWLREWHDRHAGATRQAFSHRQTTNGLSTYERLAQGVSGTVLDLCCGDGPLLTVLQDQGCSAVGVDLSPGELAAARAVVSPSTTLVLGSASSLPFPDDHFDAVLCHMALMLLDDLDAVLAEVTRVLRPGGEFRAVIGRGPSPGVNAWATLVEHLRPLSMDRPPLGDRRCRRDDTLQQALAHAGLTDVRTERWELVADDTPAGVWRFFELSYDHEPLAPDERAALQAALVPKWQLIASPSSLVPCRLALCCATARRPLEPRG